MNAEYPSYLHYKTTLKTIESNLTKIKSAIKNNRKYVFVQSDYGTVEVEIKNPSFLDQHSKKWNATQKGLASLFLAQVVGCIDNKEKRQINTVDNIIKILHETENHVISDIIYNFHLTERDKEAIFKKLNDVENNVREPITYLKFAKFIEKLSKDNSINSSDETFVNSVDLLTYELKHTILGNCTPEKAEKLRNLHIRLNKHYDNLPQKWEFKELEAFAQTAFFLKLCESPLELQILTKTLESHPDSVQATAFKKLFEIVSTKQIILDSHYETVKNLKEIMASLESSKFVEKFSRGDAVTLFDSKPFLAHKIEYMISGKCLSEKAVEFQDLHVRLKKFYADSHQKGGFEELEVTARQKAFIKLCDDPPRLQNLAKTLESSPKTVQATAFEELCEQVIRDIVNKAKEQPSIHGHPRDLYNRNDIRSLQSILSVFPPESPLYKNAESNMTIITEKLKEANDALDKLEPLFKLIINKINHSPPIEPMRDSELIIQAKQALMDIDLGPCRSIELNLLREHALISKENKQGLENLIILDNIRSEHIDLELLRLYEREHNEVQEHPRVAIEGGGPTGLLLAITQFRSGATVSLFEKRSTQYDRTQIVRLDPKWMRMLKFYLGEEYHKMFTDKGNKGIIRDDGFGEIATLYLEDVLHKKFTELISIIPSNSRKVPPIERLAAYGMHQVIPPKQQGGKFQVMAQYVAKSDIANEAAQKENEPEIRRDVDVVISAGGKSSPLRETFLPSSIAVNNKSNYGVCSWIAPKIPGQNPEKMNLFQDFRNMVHINTDFRLKFQEQLMEDFNEENILELELFPRLREKFLTLLQSEATSSFIKNGPAQPYIQTRTFENLGLVYIGMEIPQEVHDLMSNWEIALNSEIEHILNEEQQLKQNLLLNQKKAIMNQIHRRWFQCIMDVYHLDKETQLTIDKIDTRFSALFPVEQHRMHPDHSFSRIEKGGSELLILAAGDAFASPHFMRYSGLTGARENILHYQAYMHNVTHNANFKADKEKALELVRTQGDKTASFVIGRGDAFLTRKQEEQIKKERTEKMIGLLKRETEKLEKEKNSPYKLTLREDESFYELAIKDGPLLHIRAKEGWFDVVTQGHEDITRYESFEQLKLAYGLTHL